MQLNILVDETCPICTQSQLAGPEDRQARAVMLESAGYADEKLKKMVD
jgi:hypothetical protein